MSHLFSPYGNFTRATKDGQRFTIISGCCNGLLRLLVVVRWLDGGGLIPPMSVLGWFRTQLQQRYIDSYVYIYIYMMYWFNTISSSTFLFSIMFSCYMFLLCDQLVIHIYQYIYVIIFMILYLLVLDQYISYSHRAIGIHSFCI